MCREISTSDSNGNVPAIAIAGTIPENITNDTDRTGTTD